MPSKSSKQARLMAAVAHDPGFAKKVGIPQSVGKDFNSSDRGTGVLSSEPHLAKHHKKAKLPVRKPY